MLDFIYYYYVYVKIRPQLGNMFCCHRLYYVNIFYIHEMMEYLINAMFVWRLFLRKLFRLNIKHSENSEWTFYLYKYLLFLGMRLQW